MAELARHDLLARLDDLERRYRRLKRTMTAGLLMLAGVFALAVAEPQKLPTPSRPSAVSAAMEKTVSASEFIVVDQDGRRRGSFGMLPDGNMALALTGTDGVPLIAMGVEKNLPGIEIYGPGMKRRGRLSVGADGTFLLQLGDEAGGTRVGLGAKGNGDTALTLCDGNAKPLAMMAVGKGHPGIGLYDEDGRVSGAFGVEPDGSLKLALFDAAGKVRAGLGIQPDGSPSLGLADAGGKAVFRAP